MSITDFSIENKVKRFYDAGTPFYYKIFGLHIHDGYYPTGRESRQEAQEELIRLLSDKGGIKNGNKILDVGCGVGGSSIWLALNLGVIATGITISPVQLDIARKLAREKQADSTFLLMDAQNLNFSEPFDAIWVLAALTHFPNQQDFLIRTSQLLKPEGKLIIYDWILNEGLDKISDQEIQSVIDGMVLSNLFPGNIYLKWIMESGYRVTYVEDITSKTIRTWDVDSTVLSVPGIWKLAKGYNYESIRETFTFLRGRRAIKQAMQKGKVKSLAIVAEKIR